MAVCLHLQGTADLKDINHPADNDLLQRSLRVQACTNRAWLHSQQGRLSPDLAAPV